MFPPHLILLTTRQNTPIVKSLDRLTESSSRFDEFERIEVLNWTNQFDLEPTARYHIDEDRWFLISYDTATHLFTIDAEYPEELWETDEFDMSDGVAYNPNYYHATVAACIENGFDPDFSPVPKIWRAEDLSEGVYSHRRDLTSGRSGSIRAVAVPSFGRWAMQEIE